LIKDALSCSSILPVFIFQTQLSRQPCSCDPLFLFAKTFSVFEEPCFRALGSLF
jgi:hypothetical protein